MANLRRLARPVLLGSSFCLAGAAAASLGAIAALARRRGSGCTGKSVLITGGSRGLGLALAERFARAGCRIALVARDPDELARARQLLLDRRAILDPDRLLLITADVTVRAQAQAAVQDTVAAFGRLDILINNAGIIEVAPFQNQPLEAFQRSIDTHLYAPLHTIQAALPHMLQRRPPGTKTSAHIVNIASIGGKVSVPHLLPYCAGKFALVGLSQGLHAELRQKGIHVTTVNPGLLRTGSFVQARFAGQSGKEFRWFSLSSIMPLLAASAAHAADRIFHAVAAGRAEITITPQAALAARLAGLCPGTTQTLAALANQFLLPDAADPACASAEPIPGACLQPPSGRAVKLQARNNQLAHPA
jgi:NAD(P)-dependent dehydrogenase (short-subunit alcohol dehydrogenase family)